MDVSYIVDIAMKNGYTAEVIEKLIKKKKKDQDTTFFGQTITLEETKWISIPLPNIYTKLNLI